MIRRALAPLAMVLILVLPVTAWAAPKVAVTAIEGDAEGEVRDVIVDALDGEDYKLISKKETSKAAGKIDLAELSEKSAKKLAKDLSADAIISGSLEKSGATKTLKIKLFVNGKMKKGFSVKFKGSPGGAKFKKAIRKTLLDRLDGMTEMAAEEEAPKKSKKVAEEEEEEEAPPKKSKKAEPEKAVKTAKNGKAGKAEKAQKAEATEPEESSEKSESSESSEEEAAAKAPAEGEEEEETKPAPRKVAALDEGDDEEMVVSRRVAPRSSGRSVNRAAARIEVGPSMVKRSLVFNENLPSDQEPKPFRPSPVPGVRVGGELYPLGFVSPDSLLAGIGVGFKFDRTLIMKVAPKADPNTQLPTTQHNYAAGLRLRIVGKSPTSPSVTLHADIGRSRFKPDRSGLMEGQVLDLPSTYYKFMAPGLSFRIPLGGVIAFSAGGEALLVSDAGQIVRSTSYGRAKVLGYDVEGGLDIILMKRFVVRLSGGFTQIAYTFQGRGGALANNRDGNPDTLDVGGAADRAISAAMTIGVAY